MKKLIATRLVFIIISLIALRFEVRAQEPGDNAIKPTGTFYALIIGVSQYDNPKLALDRPAKDAQKFKEVICSKYSFDEKNVKLLLSPSRQQIIAEIFNLRKIITTNDNLLIFYAGHGYWDDQASQGYWWPKDAAVVEPSNWLSNSDLKEQIRGIKSAHTLLISDACFSGGIFKTRSAAEAIKNSSFNIQMLYKMPSRRAMTSGTLTTVPDESVFFSYLIKRLNDNTEKFLASQDLFSSLKQAVINNSMVVPQDGVIAESGDEGGDFIFILKDNAATTTASTSSTSTSANKITRGGVTAGPSFDELMESGRENFNNRKFNEAFADFSKAIALDPQNAQAYNARGRANVNLKKLQPAVADFSKAIELNPNFAWAYCLRGAAKSDMRKRKEAMIDFDKAIDINPRYTYAYNFRGVEEMEERKYDEAIRDFSEAINLDVKFAAAYDNRGIAKIRMEKPAEAIADFSKAIEINPKFAVAYCNMGAAKVKLGKLDEAAADIAKSLELEPKLARAYVCRGLLDMKLGKADDAIADFSKSIEINPRHIEAYMYRAKASAGKKDYQSALTDVNKVLEQWPNNKEALSMKEQIQKHQ